MKLFGKGVKKTFRKLNERPMSIVADAAIATGAIGHGRLIPLIILDTSEHLDFEELIRVHKYVRPGDVVSQWATVEDGSGNIGLLLKFDRPMAISTFIVFDIIKQGVLVDQIVRMKGLYIQAGRHGDRFIKDPDRPKVLIEIPDTGFSRVWNTLFYKSIIKRMREVGLSRREAKIMAQSHIDGWRNFTEFRMKTDCDASKVENPK